jgi:hypothetical protein
VDLGENQELNGSGHRTRCGGQQLPTSCLLRLAEIPAEGVAVRSESQKGFRSSIETAITHTFLPAMFGDEYNKDDPQRKLTCLPVKHASLALPDLTASAQSNYEASILVCSYLLAALRGVNEF